MLMLLITYFLVTQFITRLEQRKYKAPHELHSCWVVFSVTREMQKWLLKMRIELPGCRKQLQLWTFVLTCIHKMCRHSCPATPRLGEGPLFPLLLKKWMKDKISQIFHISTFLLNLWYQQSHTCFYRWCYRSPGLKKKKGCWSFGR